MTTNNNNNPNQCQETLMGDHDDYPVNGNDSKRQKMSTKKYIPKNISQNDFVKKNVTGKENDMHESELVGNTTDKVSALGDILEDVPASRLNQLLEASNGSIGHAIEIHFGQMKQASRPVNEKRKRIISPITASSDSRERPHQALPNNGNVASDEVKRWIATAAACDDGAGLPLEEINPDCKEEMEKVCDALGAKDFGPKLRLKKYIKSLQQQQQQTPHEFATPIPSRGSPPSDYIRSLHQQQQQTPQEIATPIPSRGPSPSDGNFPAKYPETEPTSGNQSLPSNLDIAIGKLEALTDEKMPHDIKMAFSGQLKCHDFCNHVFDANGKAKGKGVGANWLRKQPGRYGKVAKEYIDRLTKEECEKERKKEKPNLKEATKRTKKHFEKQVGKYVLNPIKESGGNFSTMVAPARPSQLLAVPNGLPSDPLQRQVVQHPVGANPGGYGHNYSGNNLFRRGHSSPLSTNTSQAGLEVPDCETARTTAANSSAPAKAQQATVTNSSVTDDPSESSSQDNSSSKSSSDNDVAIMNDENFEENNRKFLAVQKLFERKGMLAKKMRLQNKGIPEEYNLGLIAAKCCDTKWTNEHFYNAVDNLNRIDLFRARVELGVHPTIELILDSPNRPDHKETAVYSVAKNYLTQAVEDEKRVEELKKKNGGKHGYIFVVCVGVEENGDPVFCIGHIHTEEKKAILEGGKVHAPLGPHYKKILESHSFNKLVKQAIEKSFDLVGANVPGTTTDRDNEILREISDDINEKKGIRGSCAIYKGMNIIVNQNACGALCKRTKFALNGIKIGKPAIVFNPWRYNKSTRNFSDFIKETFEKLPEEYKEILMMNHQKRV